MNVNSLRKNIEKNNIEEASNDLKNLYQEKPEKFRKAILLGNVLPYPFNSDITRIRQILNSFDDSYKLATKKLILEKTGDVDSFIRICDELYTIVYILSFNYNSNCELLMKSDFFKYDYVTKLQLLCILKENFYMQASNSINSDVQKKKIFNVSSSLVGEITQYDNSKISHEDQDEFVIEVIDEIIKYIFFLDRESQDQLNGSVVYDGNLSLSNHAMREVFLLGQHRKHLLNIWDKVKYGQWSYEVVNDKNGLYYNFIPNEMVNYKKYRAATIRNQNRFYVNYTKAVNYHFKSIQKSFRLIKDLSSKLDIFDINSLFTLDSKIIKEICECYSGLMDAELIRIRKVFGDKLFDLKLGELKDIKVSEYLQMYNFLTNVARIYEEALQNISYSSSMDYRIMAPRISINSISSKFTEIFGESSEKAIKLINLFILKPGSKFDLFVQPLVKCDNDGILFTSSVIVAMNSSRAVECQLSFWKTDISNKGIVFEEKLRDTINSSPYIKANKNDIKFEAYDGKTVQFDFLASFDNCVLIVEDKCILEPFSDREIYEIFKKDIKDDAFIQLNRRADILINDWDKVRANSNIGLPIQSPNLKQILKVVCVNMFNFTGQIIDDVVITDYNTLVNYFSQPIIEKSVFQSGVKKQSTLYNIWGKGYPTIDEFKEYLMMPVGIRGIYSKLRDCFYQVPLIKNSDYKIRCLDLYLEESLDKIDQATQFDARKYERVGRNDPCPCGSINPQTGRRIKYKKCCGKNI